MIRAGRDRAIASPESAASHPAQTEPGKGHRTRRSCARAGDRACCESGESIRSAAAVGNVVSIGAGQRQRKLGYPGLPSGVSALNRVACDR